MVAKVYARSARLPLEHTHTGVDATSSLTVNYLLIELLPFFNETRPEMIDVTNTGAVYPLLQDTPYVIVDWIQIRTVRWPLLIVSSLQTHFPVSTL